MKEFREEYEDTKLEKFGLEFRKIALLKKMHIKNIGRWEESGTRS